jgi:oxepin-CoA hydrolase / 3-oxo-5,6-dehydrosuberyl-CoA semialdehyde dehydrogenase
MSDPEPATEPARDRLRPGAPIETPSKPVTVAEIEEFAHLTGDENPLHIDEEVARRGLFQGRVAHGLLTLSFTLGLWYRAGLFEGHTVVFSGIDRLRFLRPVRPGESLLARLTVTERSPSSRGDIVNLDNTTYNEKGEPVLSFTARLLLAAPVQKPSA